MDHEQEYAEDRWQKERYRMKLAFDGEREAGGKERSMEWRLRRSTMEVEMEHGG